MLPPSWGEAVSSVHMLTGILIREVGRIDNSPPKMATFSPSPRLNYLKDMMKTNNICRFELFQYSPLPLNLMRLHGGITRGAATVASTGGGRWWQDKCSLLK